MNASVSSHFSDLDGLLAETRQFAEENGIDPSQDFLQRACRPGILLPAAAVTACVLAKMRPRPAVAIPLGLGVFVASSMLFRVFGDIVNEVTAPDVFVCEGKMSEVKLQKLIRHLEGTNIEIRIEEMEDWKAGEIEVVAESLRKKDHRRYLMRLNSSHSSVLMFAIILHELAHLFLGHIGRNPQYGIRDRSRLGNTTKEIEAECVARDVCRQYGIELKSHHYLSRLDLSEVADVDFDVPRIRRATERLKEIISIVAD